MNQDVKFKRIKSYIDRFPKVMEIASSFLDLSDVSFENFFNYDTSEKDLIRIETFIRDHDLSNFIINHFDHSSLNDLVNNISKIIKISKKRGEFVIGILEELSYRSEYKFNDYEINLYIDRYLLESDENLVTPSGLSIDGVRELVSKTDLIKEGSCMGHCVGGYSDTVRRGNSRVFHISLDGESTVQINIAGQGEIVQHKSIRNEEPSKENIKIGKIIEAFFFKDKIEEEFIGEF